MTGGDIVPYIKPNYNLAFIKKGERAESIVWQGDEVAVGDLSLYNPTQIIK